MNHSMRCPHCDNRALQRRSEPMSSLVREKTYQCSHLECGHVFIAVEEIQRTLVPPRTPKLGVDLPLAKVAGAIADAANLSK